VYCLNATTGALVWRYRTNDSVDSSPTVSGGFVYIGSDNATYCLNATTGTLAWKYATGISGWSVPSVAGGLVYVGSWDDNVYCLNATSGMLVWKYKTGGVVFSSPTIVGEVVYVGSGDGNLYCLNATTGVQIWSFATGGSVSSSAAVVDDMIYFGSENGSFYCLNASGSEVWKCAIGSVAFSSAAVTDGLIYVGSLNGKVYCLNATTGTSVWSFTTGDAVFSSPAVASSLVYFGSYDQKVYCLNAATGAMVWSYNTSAVVFSSPAVVNGVVYIGSEYPGATIYAIGGTPPLKASISPTQVATDLGRTQAFNSWVTGGLAPYRYQWYLDGAPISGATSSTLTFTINSTGSHTIYVEATDNTGATANSNTANVMVNLAVSVTIHPVDGLVFLGQQPLIVPVLFSNVSGGTAPYTYQWYFNNTKISGATDLTWLFTLLTAGSYNVYVAVADSAGATATSNIAQILVIPALNVTISSSGGFISLGGSVSFTSTVTGGIQTHQYQWYVNGTTVPGGTNPTWTFTPSKTGTYDIYLNVTDMWFFHARSNIAQVTVTKAASVGGVSTAGNENGILESWLGIVSLLAAAVTLVKRNHYRKQKISLNT